MQADSIPHLRELAHGLCRRAVCDVQSFVGVKHRHCYRLACGLAKPVENVLKGGSNRSTGGCCQSEKGTSDGVLAPSRLDDIAARGQSPQNAVDGGARQPRTLSEQSE